jgi:hypothetical protein
MALQHDALERRAFSQVSIHNHLMRTGHSLEFHLEERLALVSSRIRRWIKKVFDCLALSNARRKVERELDVKLHGTDDDHEFMARRNARRETSGMEKIDRSVLRVREAVHEASVNRSYE